MKKIMTISMLRLFIALIFLMSLPVWLYASGNLPFLPCNQEIAVKNTLRFQFPAKYTYKVSHFLLEALRNRRIDIPVTQAEKLMQGRYPVDQYFEQKKLIMALRCRVDRICEEIIADCIRNRDDLNG